MNLQLIAFLADLIEKIYKSTTINDTAWTTSILAEEFHTRMRLLGYTKIGNGVYRNVFTHILTPDVVYKFGNWNSNGQEYNLWTHIPDSKRNRLAALYYTNGLVNVMEKVDKVVRELENSQLVVNSASKELIDDTLYVEDTHAGNWGVRKDGTVILIDYGDYHYVPKINTDLSIPDYPAWERQYRNKLGTARMADILKFNNKYDIHAINNSYFDNLPEVNQYYLPLIIEQKEQQLLLELQEEIDENKPKTVEEDKTPKVYKRVNDWGGFRHEVIAGGAMFFDNQVFADVAMPEVKEEVVIKHHKPKHRHNLNARDKHAFKHRQNRGLVNRARR